MQSWYKQIHYDISTILVWSKALGLSISNTSIVARAVILTPLSLFNNLFIRSDKIFLQIFITVRARELKCLDNVHPPPHVMGHISHVICHVSPVMCHMSCVMCHVFSFLSGGASRWRVCYQLGLPSYSSPR